MSARLASTRIGHCVSSLVLVAIVLGVAAPLTALPGFFRDRCLKTCCRLARQCCCRSSAKKGEGGWWQTQERSCPAECGRATAPVTSLWLPWLADCRWVRPDAPQQRTPTAAEPLISVCRRETALYQRPPPIRSSS